MVKIIKFFLFDDLNYRIDYTSEGVDKKISAIILSLFLNYFIKGINIGILYKKIDNKYLILKVESEELDGAYVIKFVYLDSLNDYPVKLMYENGFIDNDFKHSEYDNLEFETLSKYMKSIDAVGFRQIVSAIFKAQYYNSAVRLRGNTKELLLWIASIQMIFPKEFAEDISFKIEQYKNDIGMASLSISDNIIDIRYKINIENEDLSMERYKFTSLLQRHYLLPSTNLEAFFLFVTYFDYKKLDERLEDIYNIYMISRLGIGDIDYSTVKLAIDNLEEIGSKEAKRVVILNMLKVIEKLTTEMDVKFFKLIMSFAFRACNEMESLFINEMCKELYLKSLVSILFSGRYKSIESFEQAVNEIENIAEKKSLYKYMLDDKRLEHIGIYLDLDCTPERVLVMLKYLLKYNIELGYKWSKFTQKFIDIIAKGISIIAKSELDLEDFLHTIALDEEYLARVLTDIYVAIDNEKIQLSFVSKVSEFLDEVEDDRIVELRKRISSIEAGNHLLYEEFKMSMEIKGHTTKGFEEYIESFYTSKEYFNKCFSRAVAYMLANLDDKEDYKFSLFIINEMKENKFDYSYLPDKVLSDIVLGIEKYVDFENCEEIYEILSFITRLKKDRAIRTSINITGLLELQRLIQDGEDIDPYEYEAPDMKPHKLSEESYKKYRDLNLEKIIGMCRDKEEHKAIADVFMTKDNFIFDYMKIALNDNNVNKDVSLSFLIYYLYYVHPMYKVSGKEEILMELRMMIIERISELSFSAVCDIDDKVKGEFEKMNLSMPVEWEEIFTSIKKIKSEGNFVNKLKFMMKK
ncbi:hypothetical protein [Clostridium cylindrosporum]|uniref:Uncharacterized protein n=1 Tax=Clostridium cylindrosporum DSM 605 TaxID=1121307 RepID=A0A0J8DB78_CLOCY|nr:hypothetical protein [Clostridium cylindrosporum]KMT23330.1 hypothetical protein CLCY_8c00660 [Clostridium cylindrosporum DSM 605]